LLRFARKDRLSDVSTFILTSVIGEYAKRQGCYVIHRGGSILYVGKTDGSTMTFGMRLRREFQETASQGRHIYPKLAAFTVPPEIQASFLSFPQIRDLVCCEETDLDDLSKIAIVEQTLIQIYEPEFQTRKNSSRI
jgi:hypothetical protein